MSRNGWLVSKAINLYPNCNKPIPIRFCVHCFNMEDKGSHEIAGGVEQFACDACLKVFVRKDSLSRHVKEQHENGKEHVACDICGKKILSRNLRDHLKTQHQVRQKLVESNLACLSCPKKLSNLENLRCHVASEHGSKQQQEQHSFKDEPGK